MDDSETYRSVPKIGGDEMTHERPASPTVQRVQVDVDDSKALTCYANFCRVTSTPEELIIDFGLSPQPTGEPTQPVAVTQRIVANLYTAKRLQDVLRQTVQRHESTFGTLEIDLQQRLGRA